MMLFVAFAELPDQRLPMPPATLPAELPVIVQLMMVAARGPVPVAIRHPRIRPSCVRLHNQ